MFQVINKNNTNHLKTISDNTIDSIITDPPYGIEFLGKDWDKNTGTIECWKECLRVLKPGGHLLAFSSARTYHILATNIQEVGFDIRDQLMWLYASGFPKAQDIGKSIQKRQGVEKQVPSTSMRASAAYKCEERYGNQNAKAVGFSGMDTIPTSPEAIKWAGWKTALKPSHEPIVLARKPFKGSTIDNVQKHNVGALNIDASRIPFEGEKDIKSAQGFKGKQGTKVFNNFSPEKTDKEYDNDETLGMPNGQGRFPSNVIGEVAEGYQKYFYCPKVSRKERHTGFEQTSLPDRLCGDGGDDFIVKNENYLLRKNKDPLAHIPAPFGDVKGCYQDGERFAAVHQKLQGDYTQTGTLGRMKDSYEQSTKSVGNNHPTVKPVALMRYLIKLVTPPNSLVLDPFCGSGSTGMAATELGHEFIGIELDANYCEIAKKRITAWNQPKTHENNFNELFEKKAS